MLVHLVAAIVQKFSNCNKKVWWSTIMHEPLVKSTLQIHTLQQLWKDVSKEIAARSPSPSRQK
jgi:hypothetical protein